MSFFKAIAPLCAAGVAFTIRVEAADAGRLAVQILPTSATGKTGYNLTPKQFTATPEEFDAEFGTTMAGYAVIQQTLKQQLDDVALVSAATAKAAVAEAEEKRKAAPASAPRSVAKASKGNLAPAGLLNDDAEEGGSGDGGEDDANDNVEKSAVTVSSGGSSPSGTAVASASASAGSFNFDL
jgi:PRTRC genetic system protein E